MKPGWYKILLAMAGIALCVFLAVQINWFRKAKQLEESQFDREVNLSLRAVADKLLKTQQDASSRVAPVKKRASNVFEIRLNTFIPYRTLDSLVRASFDLNSIVEPYRISIHAEATDSLLLGGFYPKGTRTKKEDISCLRRDQAEVPMYFIVSFPSRQTSVLQGMSFWTYSGIAFLCIMVIFAYLIFDLSRRNRLAQLKTDFVNNMTHELQTPIANISMASEVLRSGKISDPKRTSQYLDIIFQENQRLRQHVEQVLQTARLERGELPLNRKQVDLHNILEEVIAKFQLRIKKKGGHLTLQPSADKTVVLGDQTHLSNLFYNLLDNADKYSPARAEIVITTKNHEAGIEVSIADKGIGIRKEDQPLVFEKFYRATTGNQHDIKGFGMGLAYVKEIVTAHGGTVTLSSEEHQGSCFNIWLQNC
jgi:two-component system phosphate regulon sensor histidine kinase PhoR